MDELTLQQKGDAILFQVRVAPRASRTAIIGVHGGALKVALTAAPVEGAANAALIKFLAEKLDVPARSINITHGGGSRTKTVKVEGLDVQSARKALAPAKE